MRRRCLVDASSVLTWVLREGPDPAAVRQKLDGIDGVVPSLWRLEVVHAMLVRQRRKKNTVAEIRRFLSVLDAFPVEVIPDAGEQPLSRLFDVAKPHQLSSYDAVYLDAALRFRLPLLTHDRNLKLAAEREGVELL